METELRSILREKSYEIQILKKKIADLEINIVNLEEKNSALEKDKIFLRNHDNLYRLQEKKLSDCQEELNIQNEKRRILESNLKQEFAEVVRKKDSEIHRLNSQINQIQNKFEIAIKYESYMKEIEIFNEELREKVRKLENDHIIELKTKKDKYYEKLSNIKKSTLDILNKNKREATNAALQNMTNSYKITLMLNSQLYDELNEQSLILDELLTKLEEKENFIKNLKLEVKIHKELEKITIKHKSIIENAYLELSKSLEEMKLVKRQEEAKVIKLIERKNSRNPVVNKNTFKEIPEYKTATSFMKTKSSESKFELKKNHKTNMNLKNDKIPDLKKIQTNKVNYLTKLEKFTWYFDLIERYFDILKSDNILTSKINEIFLFKQEDIYKISRFLKDLHTEICEKFKKIKFQNNLEQILPPKINSKRSKSILDDFEKISLF